MKKYLDFDIDELVLDVYFRKWATNQLPKGDTFWDEIRKANPAFAQRMQIAKEITLSLEINHDDLTDAEIHHEIERIYQVAVEKPPIRLTPIYRQQWFKYAASLVLLVGIGWVIKKNLLSEPLTNVPSIAKSSQDEVIRLVNDGVNATKHTLPDGSTVLLKQKSELVFLKKFKPNKREVSLKGEAFFEVLRDTTRPFMVISEKVVTKVLGTKFTVTAKENDANILVAVKSGKVGLSKVENTENNGLVLTENQSGLFNKETGEFLKYSTFKFVKKNDFFLQSFDFVRTPLPKVFEELEKAYDVRIIYDPDKVKNCTITAKLRNDSIDKILNFIAKETRVKYEKFSGKVLILSQGC